MAEKIINFFHLVENKFYKIVKIETIKTEYTSKQLVFTIEDGQRLFGKFGIGELFKTYTTPFFFDLEVCQRLSSLRDTKFVCIEMLKNCYPKPIEK